MNSLGRSIQNIFRKVPVFSSSTIQKRYFFDALTRNVQSKRHSERRLLRYPNTLLYEVVSDVSNYDKFVPWCKKSRVLKQTDTAMTAELQVGFQMLSENYLSQVALDKPRAVVATSTQTQLFEHLRSEWRFQPASGDVETATWVNFSVEFKFKSALYNEVSELFMQEVVKKMVGAFELRCRELHQQRQLHKK